MADLIGLFRGCGVATEVRANKSKLTLAQAKFLKNCAQAGLIGIKARDVENAADELGNIFADVT